MFLGNRGLNLTIDLRRRSDAAEGLRRLSRTAACATPECGRTPHDLLDAQLARYMCVVEVCKSGHYFLEPYIWPGHDVLGMSAIQRFRAFAEPKEPCR
jgi:hypothetical protein